MTDYKPLLKDLRGRARACVATDNPTMAGVFNNAAEAIDDLTESLRRCRNELCLYCGKYKMRHFGACDGCIWKEVG